MQRLYTNNRVGTTNPHPRMRVGERRIRFADKIKNKKSISLRSQHEKLKLALKSTRLCDILIL